MNNKKIKKINKNLRQIIEKIHNLSRDIEAWNKYLHESCGRVFKKVGKQYATTCPFHSDKNPSLYVVLNKFEFPVFKCFGCGISGDFIKFVSRLCNIKTIKAIEKICQDFDIPCSITNKDTNKDNQTQSNESTDVANDEVEELINTYLSHVSDEIDNIFNDVFPPLPEQKQEEESIVYLYRAPDGKILYRKIRKPGKQFIMTFYDDDKQLILFNLDKLYKARTQDDVSEIFVTEGEKDCLNLEKFLFERGYNAAVISTCSCFENDFKNTIKKFPEVINLLKNVHIYVVADNDVKGYKNASEAILLLKDIALEIKLISFKNKAQGYDISDFLAEHNKSKEKFEELLANADTIVKDYKSAQNIFIVTQDSNFASLFSENNYILTDKQLQTLSEQELIEIVEYKNVFIDEKIYKTSLKFPFLKLSFYTNKTVVFSDEKKKVIFDRQEASKTYTLREIVELPYEDESNHDEEDIKPADPILSLPPSATSILAGPGEAGKTTFSLLYLLYLLQENIIHHACFLSFEESKKYIKHRIKSLSYNLLLDPDTKRKLTVWTAQALSCKYVLNLCDYLLRFTDIIIVDNLSLLLQNEIDNSAVTKFLASFAELCKTHNKIIIFLHHVSQSFFTLRQRKYKDFFDFESTLAAAVRGATSFLNAVRSVYLLLNLPYENEIYSYLLNVKNNIAQKARIQVKHFKEISRPLNIKKAEKFDTKFNPSALFTRINTEQFFEMHLKDNKKSKASGTKRYKKRNNYRDFTEPATGQELTEEVINKIFQ